MTNSIYQKRLRESETLFAYERELYTSSCIIVGIDEVGRGSLAGPVTAAAVVLGAEWQPEYAPGLRDSKQLNAKRRAELAGQLAESALSLSIAHVEAAVIDQVGIMPALHRAMKDALYGLGLQEEPDHILIDGLPLGLFPKEEAIVKGDSKVACIAAASILAKESRDQLMIDAARQYPEYGFESNKGYGSAVHQQAIVKHGLTPLHRHSFCGNFLQDSLF